MPSGEDMQLVRWGVIGPGRAAARFAQGLNGVPGATLAAVWGRNQERSLEFAQRFSVQSVCETLPELLASSVDAVYVATHPDTHAELCIDALRSGKHVLCEKPAALNVRQLDEVLAAARHYDRLFMEAMKPPFFPLYRRLREHLNRIPSAKLASSARDTATQPFRRITPSTSQSWAAAESWASAPTKRFSPSTGLVN